MKKTNTFIHALYMQQMMIPGLPALFFNPYFLARRGLAGHIRKMASGIAGRALDVGCGMKPYESFCNTTSYSGLELFGHSPQHTSGADLFYDGYHFPFKPAAFDAIMCSQVLEHVRHPNNFLAEINRITKPGGKLLLTVPFFWGEHEKPSDFQRYSSYGIERLLDCAGFEVEAFEKSVPGLQALFALGVANLYERLKIDNPVGNLALAVLLATPLNLMGLASGWILPKNPDIYLDNIILGRKR